jgi:AbrB family looped-hinge helix DNA binding protein
MQITLDKFGRILIPKKLRERLGLRPDDVLEVQLEDGKLTLLPQRTPPPLRRKGRVLVVESGATANLGQALIHLREERLDELSR